MSQRPLHRATSHLTQQLREAFWQHLAEHVFEFGGRPFAAALAQPFARAATGEKINRDVVAVLPIGRDLQDRRPRKPAVGEKQAGIKAAFATDHHGRQADASQRPVKATCRLGQSEGHEAGSGGQDLVPEVAGELVTEIGGTHQRHRKPAGRHHQGFGPQSATARFEPEAPLHFGHLGHLGADLDHHLGVPAFGHQQIDDLARAVVAKKLPALLFVEGYAVARHQLDEIRRGVPRQRRFAEVGIGRKIVGRSDVQVGEIAASTPRHQDLFAHPLGMFDQANTASPLPGHRRTHQSGGTAAHHHYVGLEAHAFSFGTSYHRKPRTQKSRGKPRLPARRIPPRQFFWMVSRACFSSAFCFSSSSKRW